MPREPPVTFPLENGGHGGPGREETHGFILLPERIDRWHHEDGPDRDKVLRGTRLHRIVRHFLHEDPVMTGGLATNDGGAPSLRVATYNVHGCVGLDGRMRPDRIARVVNSLRPDVIALQEVDVHRPRSRKLDQPHEIGRRLDMEHVFHSMLEEHDERYGIAILSRHPLELVRKGLLTAASRRPPREARGAIWVRIRPEGFRKPVNFINTHFGLGRDERRRQVEVPIGGRVNVANAVATLTTATAVGIDPDVAVAGIATLAPVPGRFEAIPEARVLGGTVVVDYAHTPDGISEVLASARAAASSWRLRRPCQTMDSMCSMVSKWSASNSMGLE